jgi:hypothetical protein
MNYFAQINESNLITWVIVADSKEWCEENLGGTWVQAHNPLDAAIGYTYNKERDAFIPPKPFNKWVLNEDTCIWESPVPYPDDENEYVWNDNKGVWEELILD